MASSSDRGAPRPARGTRRNRRADLAQNPTATGIVDSWIDERLRALYESDLKDPLPQDMLNLVRTAVKRGGGTT